MAIVTDSSAAYYLETAYSSAVVTAIARITSTANITSNSAMLCVQTLCMPNTSYWVRGRNVSSCSYVLQPLIVEIYPSITGKI